MQVSKTLVLAESCLCLRIFGPGKSSFSCLIFSFKSSRTSLGESLNFVELLNEHESAIKIAAKRSSLSFLYVSPSISFLASAICCIPEFFHQAVMVKVAQLLEVLAKPEHIAIVLAVFKVLCNCLAISKPCCPLLVCVFMHNNYCSNKVTQLLELVICCLVETVTK